MLAPRTALSALAIAVLGVLLELGAAHAQTALPSGGRVAAGQASIGAPSASGLTVTQSSDRAVINWTRFDVGAGQSVSFRQPGAASATLNRVGGDATSTIAGRIEANGQVFLVNPNGISITSTGSVRASGFVASTLDIGDADFLSGRLDFRGTGNSARVTNAGRIEALTGGFAALLGGGVAQHGTMSVPLGRIGLASGERVTLDLQGNGFMQVAVPSAGAGGEALVEQAGAVQADGGRVQISVAAAREAARQAVNLTGVAQARSVGGRSGTVVLDGGEGRVQVLGRIDASAPDGGRGGNVQILGTGAIALEGARIDASGRDGGGAVRIGGDFQGGGTLARARELSVDAATTIAADAGASGDAGSVVVWSDGRTDFAGRISAQALGGTGRGGDAEVSGREWLAYKGSADLRARAGQTGTLLLDPYNVTISSAANAGAGGFAAGADNTVINTNTLQNALDTANVTVSTGSSGTQAGTITVSSAVSWASGNTLVLNAASNININAALSATGGGGISLVSGGNVSFASALSVGAGAGAGAGAGVSMSAAGSVIGASGGSVTTQGQAILLRSDSAGIGAGGISLTSNTLTSNGGAITLGGGAGAISAGSGYATGTTSAISVSGVATSSTTISAGGGDVVINGRGTQNVTAAAGNSNYGVVITGGGVSTTGSGSIRINGIGSGSGSSGFSSGIRLTTNAVVSTVDGTASLTGVSGSSGTGGSNSGVRITSSGRLLATGAGAVNITGTGANTAGTGGNNFGIDVDSASTVSAVNGGITLTGVGGGAGTGSGNHGVAISGSTTSLSTTGTGALSIIGTGGNMAGTGGSNYGVSLGGILRTTGTGTLSVTGTGSASTGTGNYGVRIGSTAVSTVNGAITVTGIGGGTGSAGSSVGVLVTGSTASLRATGTGALSITGTGGNRGGTGGNSNFGVQFDSGATAAASDGGITLSGIGGGAGTANSNYGVILIGAGTSLSTTGTGALRIDGTGGNTSGAGTGFNYGVTMNSAASASAVDGALTVNGIGGGAGTARGNSGVVLSNAGTSLSTTGTGALRITGTGGNTGGTGGNGNIGVQFDGGAAASAVDGGITLTGVGGGAGTANSNQGVVISGSTTSLTTTGNGALRIIGTGGNMAGTGGINYGVSLGGTLRTTGTGILSVTGTGGASTGTGSSANYGVSFEPASTASAVDGEFTVTGTGGGSGSGIDNFGVYISGSTTSLRTTGTGALSITGTGGNTGGTGSGNRGIQFSSGVAAAAGGTITLAADTMSLGGSVSGSGELFLRPLTTSTGIGLGDSAAGTLALSATSLATLQPGFSRITIGQASGTGTIDVRSTTFTSDLRLLGASAPISIAGTLNTGTNRLTLDTGGTVTQTAAIQAGALELLGAGGVYLLNHASNAISTVAGDTGRVQLASATSLSVGTVNASVGLRTSGTTELRALGATSDLTLAQAVVSGAGGDAVVLAAGRNFFNTVGAGAITTGPSGRFLVYSTNWDADTVGGLAAGRLYNRMYASDPPASIVQPGSQMLYSRQPMLTVSAQDASRTYGDANPAFGATITGLLAGDSAGGSYTGAAALASAATVSSDVGAHAITASQGTLASAQGYGFQYTPGTLAIGSRPITVTADNVSRTYGDVNPALAYTVGGRGLVNGDALAGGLATGANAASNVGAYAITQGTLAANSNYAVSYVPGTLAVTQRPITLTADDLSRTYGDANPALTYAVGGSGLVNGDALAGGLATGANAVSNVGAYVITQGTLAANSNYAVSYVPGLLSVTPQVLTITADDAGKLQGAGLVLTGSEFRASGLAQGDAVTAVTLTSAGAPAIAGVGLYPILATAPVGIRPGNYSITLRQGTLAIDYAPPSQGAEVRGDTGPVTTKERAPATIPGAVPPASPWVYAPDGPSDASPRPAGQAEAAEPQGRGADKTATEPRARRGAVGAAGACGSDAPDESKSSVSRSGCAAGAAR